MFCVLELCKNIFFKKSSFKLADFRLKTSAAERKLFLLIADVDTNPKPTPALPPCRRCCRHVPPQWRRSSPHAFHHSGAANTAPPPRPRTRPQASRTTARRASRTPTCVVFAVSDLARLRVPCEGTTTASRSSSPSSRRARHGTAREEARKEPAPFCRSCLLRSCRHETDPNLTQFNFAAFLTSQNSS